MVTIFMQDGRKLRAVNGGMVFLPQATTPSFKIRKDATNPSRYLLCRMDGSESSIVAILEKTRTTKGKPALVEVQRREANFFAAVSELGKQRNGGKLIDKVMGLNEEK